MRNQEISIVESTASPAGRSVAVTLLGLLTILWGVAHAVLGGCFFLGGDEMLKNLRPDDPVGGFAPVLWLLANLMIVIGVVFLLASVPGFWPVWACCGASSGVVFWRSSWPV